MILLINDKETWYFYYIIWIFQRIAIEIGTGSWYDIAALDADLYEELGKEEEGDKYQWKTGYDTVVTYYEV